MMTPMLGDKHIDIAMTRIARAAVGLSVAAFRVPDQDCTRYVLYFRQERVSAAEIIDEELQQADSPLAIQRAAVEKMVEEWQDER